MNTIWISLTIIYFCIGHIVLFITMFFPNKILPKFMRSWLILNNFILRSKGIFLTKDQNNQYFKSFEENNKNIISNTSDENNNFRNYSLKNKIGIIKDRLLLYLKFMAYIWWIYLLVIAVGKILTKLDRTLEDQL